MPSSFHRVQLFRRKKENEFIITRILLPLIIIIIREMKREREREREREMERKKK